MFYSYHQGHTTTGESIPEVLRKRQESAKWNLPYLQAILQDALWLNPKLLSQTLFEGIFRVPPGYELDCTPGKPPILKQQFQLIAKTPSPRLSLNEAKDQLFEQLLNAVTRAAPDRHTALELSGGLDSSTVSALTRKIHPKTSLHAFTHGTPNTIPPWMRDANFLHDESRWSELVSHHLQLTQHRIRSGFNLELIIEKYAECLGGCSEVLFPLLNHNVYDLAKRYEINTLLSGFGGDEVVSQHANNALIEFRNQKAYGRYAYERILKKYRELYSSKKISRPYRNNTQNRQQANSHWPYLILSNTPPIRILPTFKTVQSKEAAYIQGDLSIHWQRRIETSKLIAKAHGIDCAFPLADPELMCFFHQLPAHFKRRHGHGRYLLRKAMAAYLPDSVVWRSDKAGATAPAAYAQLVEQLPEYFLCRTDPNYTGVLKPYINFTQLRKLFETQHCLDDNIIRLSVMVLMIMHYEKKLETGSF